MKSGSTDRFSKESSEANDIDEGYPSTINTVGIHSEHRRDESIPATKTDSFWTSNEIDISFNDTEYGIEYNSDESYIIPIKPVMDFPLSLENEVIKRKEKRMFGNESRTTVRFSADNET